MKAVTERLNKELSNMNDCILDDLGLNNPETWGSMSEESLVALYHYIKLTEAVKDYTEKVNEMIDMLEKRTDMLLSVQ